ncbi:unnamed protein product [Mytilus coruscus]|uniref:Uncharacterized protein n=1 Tax=Mytilus coruscus TaxID=42192 RepID=A0A6J8EN59_MYTCO|nr:unnamed protein product [Mytilus coruscus]
MTQCQIDLVREATKCDYEQLDTNLLKREAVFTIDNETKVFIKKTGRRLQQKTFIHIVVKELFASMEKEIDNITFHEGLPSSEQVDAWSEKREHMLLILDDLLATAVNDVEVLNLFTVKSHHQNISLLMLTQNLYHSPVSFKSHSYSSKDCACSLKMMKEMILIPKHKYESVLQKQNEDQPKAEVVLNDTPSRDVNQHNLSYDQKSLHDDLQSLINITIPSRYKDKALRLLLYLQKHSSIKWDKQGEVCIDGKN